MSLSFITLQGLVMACGAFRAKNVPSFTLVLYRRFLAFGGMRYLPIPRMTLRDPGLGPEISPRGLSLLNRFKLLIENPSGVTVDRHVEPVTAFPVNDEVVQRGFVRRVTAGLGDQVDH
jgi:hypothetical protein